MDNENSAEYFPPTIERIERRIPGKVILTLDPETAENVMYVLGECRSPKGLETYKAYDALCQAFLNSPTPYRHGSVKSGIANRMVRGG